MTPPTTEHHGEELVLAGLAVVAALGVVLWLGAWLAVELFGGPRAVGFSVVAPIAALISHRGDPGAAWPIADRTSIPGPVPYWLTSGVVVTIVAAIGTLATMAWTGRHSHRRHQPTGAPSRRDVLAAGGPRATRKASARLRRAGKPPTGGGPQ
ncbi:MAG: hypothetical protein ACYCS4_11050 [Acidimicrobiales bacterium]